MKKTALILLQLLLVISAYGQQFKEEDKTNIKTTRQGFGDFRGLDMSLGFVNKRMDTEGSAYYFSDWNTEGIVYIKDKGRIKIKQVNINLHTNKLEALYEDNKVFTFDNNNIIKIVINDRIFRTFKIGDDLKITELFYNDKLAVYKSFDVTYSKGSINPMLNRKTNKYIKKEKYYLYKDNALTRFKLTKKSVSKTFKSDKKSQEQIAEFIENNNLSLKDEADLTKVLKFVSI